MGGEASPSPKGLRPLKTPFPPRVLFQVPSPICYLNFTIGGGMDFGRGVTYIQQNKL